MTSVLTTGEIWTNLNQQLFLGSLETQSHKANYPEICRVNRTQKGRAPKTAYLDKKSLGAVTDKTLT